MYQISWEEIMTANSADKATTVCHATIQSHGMKEKQGYSKSYI